MHVKTKMSELFKPVRLFLLESNDSSIISMEDDSGAHSNGVATFVYAEAYQDFPKRDDVYRGMSVRR